MFLILTLSKTAARKIPTFRLKARYIHFIQESFMPSIDNLVFFQNEEILIIR